MTIIVIFLDRRLIERSSEGKSGILKEKNTLDDILSSENIIEEVYEEQLVT